MTLAPLCIYQTRNQAFDTVHKAVPYRFYVLLLTQLAVATVVAYQAETVFVYLLMRLPVIAHQYLPAVRQVAQECLRLAVLMRLYLVPPIIVVVSHAQPPVEPVRNFALVLARVLKLYFYLFRFVEYLLGCLQKLPRLPHLTLPALIVYQKNG